jgi:hypothetical protein
MHPFSRLRRQKKKSETKTKLPLQKELAVGQKATLVIAALWHSWHHPFAGPTVHRRTISARRSGAVERLRWQGQLTGMPTTAPPGCTLATCGLDSAIQKQPAPLLHAWPCEHSEHLVPSFPASLRPSSLLLVLVLPLVTSRTELDRESFPFLCGFSSTAGLDRARILPEYPTVGSHSLSPSAVTQQRRRTRATPTAPRQSSLFPLLCWCRETTPATRLLSCLPSCPIHPLLPIRTRRCTSIARARTPSPVQPAA